jgi:two-component system, OmpR family, sensor kinase
MSRFDHLPVRWRLAITSAALTFVILLLFAVVVEVFTVNRLRSDFDRNLELTAAQLQDRIRVEPTPDGAIQLTTSPDVIDAATAGGAVIRLLDTQGVQKAASPAKAPDLGLPRAGVWDSNGYRVASRPLYAGVFHRPVAFVEYAKPKDSLNETIGHVRLFLTLGVLGGSALALLAGLAVARRAMAPIARLTRAAKQIARTRDPGVSLPQPEADDEVADLARTLAEMLAALDSARSETEAMLERQREFVADASHELRTPLTSILANLELLEAELRGEDREIAGSALRSSHRMRRLVADLLLLARADAGREAKREPVDLGHVAREAAGEVAPTSYDHELSLDADGEGLVVDGVPDELHRLAVNLIENAMRHTPPGTIIHAGVQRDNGSVVLAVEDNGPGVPPELGERIFDRFVRGLGDSAARGGSGLGLAIVRAVAESHGGSVTLESPPGGGARFVVRLPASEKQPAPDDALWAGRQLTVDS